MDPAAVASEIADAIAPAAVAGASLASGAAGIALLFHQLGRTDEAQAMLDRAVDEIAARPMAAALHGGFLGVAFAVEQLSLPDDEDLNGDVDRLLLEQLEEGPWEGEYELTGGLVGFGVYLLERIARRRPAVAERALARIVVELERKAERAGDQLHWRSAAHLGPEWLARRFPDGAVNLGLAHGVPSVVALLAGVLPTGIERARAEVLLGGATRFLVARVPATGEYPPFVDAAPIDGKAGWCYGSLGVAAALDLAAEATSDGSLRRVAHDLALRPLPPTSVAGLCHGRAGRLRILSRLHRRSGDPRLAAAARAELDALLALRTDEPIAGFPLRPDGGPPRPDAGLLHGAAGVGLALLAAARDEDPAWDGALLLSAPGLSNGVRNL